MQAEQQKKLFKYHKASLNAAQCWGDCMHHHCKTSFSDPQMLPLTHADSQGFPKTV
jgi:hypothetical protein